MKKIFILLIILLAAVILVGCTKVSMEYKLDNDNTLRVAYSVVIDTTKEEFKDFKYYNLKKAITEQWELQGIEVEVNETEEELSISGFLEKEHDTRQEAYESLASILKSEFSPFVSTGFEYASSYFEDEYNLSAKISLKDILRRSEAQVIPTDMQQMLTQFANESEFSISVSLPGEAVSTNADYKEYTDGVTTSTWNLKYGDEKDIEFKSIIVNQENVDYHKNLTDSTNLTKMIFIGCAAAAALVLIVFLIIFFVKRRRT